MRKKSSSELYPQRHVQVSDNTRTMGPKKDSQLVTDEFVSALQDEGWYALLVASSKLS